MAEHNPILEANLRAMEYIWNQVPKETKDGVEYVTYVKTDIPYLYYSGLVDTERHSLEEWEKAFEDCLGEDGRYWVSHKKMLWLGKFRYHRLVNMPFDPLKLRTGKYTMDRLWKVYEKSIIPSCSLPKEFLKKEFDLIFRKQAKMEEAFPEEFKKLKEKGEKVDPAKLSTFKFGGSGKEKYVIIEKHHLTNLKNILDTYPSPRRKLEMSVQQMRMERLQQLSDVATKPQKSSYEGGPDFRETTKKSLKETLIKASEDRNAGRKPKDEVLNLKELQKKGRPTKF